MLKVPLKVELLHSKGTARSFLSTKEFSKSNQKERQILSFALKCRKKALGMLRTQ